MVNRSLQVFGGLRLYFELVISTGDNVAVSHLSVGSRCLARDSDALWYCAMVVDVLDDGRYHVMFDLTQREAKLDANELFPLHGTAPHVCLHLFMFRICSPHMPTGKVWIYRLLFVICLLFCVCVCVCTVTDFSAEDKASGVKFCTAVHRRPRQGISYFGNCASPEAKNQTNWRARGPRPFTCKYYRRDAPT